MAIYVFKCETCGEVKEELQKSTDPAPNCPVDQQHGQMKKQFTSDWKFTFTNGKGTSGGHTIR